MKKISKKTQAMRRSEAAARANLTRWARKMFVNRYGQTSYNIAQQASHGKTTREAATNTRVNVGTVRAVYANLNRVGKFAILARLCNL